MPIHTARDGPSAHQVLQVQSSFSVLSVRDRAAFEKISKWPVYGQKPQMLLSFHFVILAQEMRQFDVLMGWSKRSSQRHESREFLGQARVISRTRSGVIHARCFWEERSAGHGSE